MDNYNEDDLNPVDLQEPPFTGRQLELLPLMARCTHANYGCASGSAYATFHNEFFAYQLDEAEQHEKAAVFMEARQ